MKITSKLSQRVVAIALVAALGVSLIAGNFYRADAAEKGSTLASVTETYVDAADGQEVSHQETYSVTHETKNPQKIADYTYLDYSEYVERVYSHKDISYIYGYPDKSVRPDRPMSRCEVVAVFNRLYDGQYPTMTRRMNEGTFSDVGTSAWYYQDLENLYNIGIVNGAGGGKFLPNEPITRAEFATMAARWAELEYTGSKTFSDVNSGYWAYGDINAAAAAGWVDGYPDGTFKPDQDIARVEVMKLVNRMVNRDITVERLRELGAVNPYNDITDKHWGYPEVMEATIRHSGADWHGTDYNDGKFNVIVERFVDKEGNEIAKTVTSDGKEQATTKEVPGFLYIGYIRHVTYVYTKGSASPAVTKEASVDEAFENDEYSYTVVVGNDKDATAAWKNVVVTDNIPKGLKLVDGSVYLNENTVAYELKDGTLTVKVGDLAEGESAKLTFKVVVQPGMAGETIKNTVVATGDNGSVKNDTHTATDKGVVINQGTILPAIEKAASTKSANVGDRVSYTITASNGADATYKITDSVISDEIPAGMVLREGSVQVNGTSAAYAYDEDSRLLSVSLGDIAPGASMKVTFSVDVDKTAYGKTIKNVAVLSGSNIPDTSDEDEGVVITAGETQPALTKQANKSEAVVGDTVTYTITASNGKDATAAIENGVITDTLPEGLEFNHGSVQIDGKSVSGTSYDEESRQLTVNVGDIAAGASVKVSFAVTITKNAYGATIKNVAVLTGDNTPETKAEDPGVVVAPGDTKPTMTKKADKAEAKVGDTITYTMTAGNAKDANVAIENGVVSDAIPQGMKFVPGSVQVDGSSAKYSFDNETNTLTVPVGDLAAGSSVKVSFSVEITKDAYGSTIKNVAVLTGDNTPDTPAEDPGVTVDDGKTRPTLTKESNKKTAEVGDTITYTLTAGDTETAAVAIEDGVITDVLPQGLEFKAGSVQVNGKSVSGTSYDDDTRTLTVPVGKIDIDSSVKVTFMATITKDAYGKTIKNVAVLSSSNGPDVNAEDPGVNIGDGKAKPTIEKTSNKKEASVGDRIEYTLTVGNEATATVDLENPVITDVIPSGLDFVDGSVYVNGKASKDYNYSDTDRILTINLENLKPDSTVEVKFSAKVNDTAYDTTIQNLATLTSDNGERKQDTDDGVIIPDGRAQLDISKVADKRTHSVGERVTYTMKVGNVAGAPVPARNVQISDTIPEGLTFAGIVQVDGFSATYSFKDGKLVIPVGDIAPGYTRTVTAVFVVNEDAYGKTITNVAVASADNAEDKPATDAGVNVPEGSPDGYAAQKTVSKNNAKVGDTLTYSFRLGNTAGATAAWENATITDTIPEGLTFKANVKMNGTSTTNYSWDEDSRTIVMTAPSIEAGKAVTFSFDVTVDEGMQGKYVVNTAIVKGPDGQPDIPVSDPGTQIDPGTVEPFSEKTANKDKVNVGETVMYTVEVGNRSSATAAWKNVVMTDTLPDGVRLLNNVTANGEPVTFSADNGVLIAKLGNIAPGETIKVKYEVLVLEEAAGTTLKNTVTLSGSPDGPGSTSKVETPVEVPEKPDNPGGGSGSEFGDVFVEKDVDKVIAKVGPDATTADRRVTYTIVATNDDKDKNVWEDVVLTDVLDDGIITLLNDSIYVDGVRLNTNQFTYRNDCLTIELGDIAAGKSKEIKFSVEFMNDAGRKSFENEATATGMLDGVKRWDTDKAPIVTVPDDNVSSSRHYAIFHGTANGDGTPSGKWDPNRNVYLYELATTAYRIMTNDYQNRLQGGTGYVPDFISNNYASDVGYIVGAGILYANEFQPASGMVEGKDYTVFGPEDNPVYNVYATRDQVGRVLQALFGSNYGVQGSGYMSRLELATVYCAVQNRDTSPDYSVAAQEGMKIAVFSDCPNNLTVYEVSNSHAYTMDSYGHETWVYNAKLY